MSGSRDDFWNIGKLLPKHRESVGRPFTAPSLTPVSDTSSATPTVKAAEARRLTALPTSSAETETTTYAPSENALIRSVTVRRAVGGHSFYEQFRRDAERYFDAPGLPCDYTPFFSFTPQYNQLSKEQMAYYFYLRSEVRAGRYPKADKGYFFLLVYEIIHLPVRVPPTEGARLLAALWGAYRESLDGIDRYMAPWLTDYCLLHAVPCPHELPSACLSAAAESDGIGFFFGTATVATPEGVLRLLSLSSDYRFEASRALTAETRTLFYRHVTGAMARVFSHLFSAGALSYSDRPERQHRRAFSGTLCSHNVRAELEIEYISLRHTDGLRRTVTLAVKHTENTLRAVLGIRARLAATGLDPVVRSVIDGYFAAVRASLPRRHPVPETPAYEMLYDAPERGIDSASAREIEAASWQLTRRLVVEEDSEGEILAIDGATDTGAPPASAPTETPGGEGAPTDTPLPLSEPQEAALADALRAFLAGGEAPRGLALRRSCPLPLLAEEVNEAFLSLYGDILLEPDGEGYTLIEEYREDTEEWLKSITK